MGAKHANVHANSPTTALAAALLDQPSPCKVLKLYIKLLTITLGPKKKSVRERKECTRMLWDPRTMINPQRQPSHKVMRKKYRH